MGEHIINLLTIMAIGVITAEIVSTANAQGTSTILQAIQGFWNVSVRGMLGQPSATPSG